MAKAKSMTIWFGDETGKRSVTVEPKGNETVGQLVDRITNGAVTSTSHTVASGGAVVGGDLASGLKEGQSVTATPNKTEGGTT